MDDVSEHHVCVVLAFDREDTSGCQLGTRLYVLLSFPPVLAQDSEWPNANPADSIDRLILIAPVALMS